MDKSLQDKKIQIAKAKTLETKNKNKGRPISPPPTKKKSKKIESANDS